jgi:DUF4097 and DUF4098 domain-containing protein YvlB
MTTRKPAAPVSHAAAGLAAFAMLACGQTALAGSPISERAPADSTGHVEISNTAGSVEVSGWARNEVEVTGTLGDGVERLEFARSGKLTRVKVILPDRSSRVGSTQLVVKVPAASSLFVNTVSADVRAQGVRGSQRLQTISGDIGAEAAAEDVECKTVSGNVEVKGSGQRSMLTVTTVSGDAKVSNVAGEVNGNTVSGSFTIAAGETSRSRLRSTSGDIGLKGKLDADARIDFESISGDVRLDLLGPVAAEFDVTSFNGEIRNCFGPKAVSTSEYAPGKELQFREGQGTGRVRIKTLNGDIGICNK